MNAPKRMTAIDGGTHHGVDWCIVTAPLYGAVNGYVRIPEDHPWSGMDYDAVHEADPHLEAPGGLTFSDGEWIGFDTLHSSDYWPGVPFHHHDEWCTHWTPEMVADETRKLAERVSLIGGVQYDAEASAR